MNASDKAMGFAQQIPGGFVFEIGNSWVQRRIHTISGRVGTTSLVSAMSGEEYLDQTNTEFELVLSGEGQIVTLDFKDFEFKGYETPNWNDSLRTLELRLAADLSDVNLPLSVFYEAAAEDNFIKKWLKVGPCDLPGWVVQSVTIESLKFKDPVEGVTPLARYPVKEANYEDKVHSDPDKVSTAERDKRFEFGDLGRAVLVYWGFDEGLFFFTHSLLGTEIFHRSKGLQMKQRDHAPLVSGLSTGPAAIGAYCGPPEIGFKRYNEHLLNNWCVIGDKSVPVSWNTWLVTLEGGEPLFSCYNRDLLFDYIELIKQAGFYDLLHLDLGWEARVPLRADQEKFPNGLNEVAKRAKEAGGLDMGYWMNPFSCSYWKSAVQDENPEWRVPGKISPRSGANALCVMSDYCKECVEPQLSALPNARLIYWDGNDWNIPECASSSHDHKSQDELEASALKRLAALCEKMHSLRPELMIVAFSLPFDNHRLCALDQEQISDTHSFPTVQSELIQRQQLYQMTWEHPYRAISSSWYGVGWHEAGADSLASRPMRELVHAEMSMIGAGLAWAGGSLDLKQVSAEFVDFLRRLIAFRKRFAPYFDSYQHVLGFPDGKSPDGEGHIVEGAGFVVLVNPTDSEQSVKLPLGDPELELPAARQHELSDWTNLDQGVPIAQTDIDHAPEILLAPLDVRYIGVNVPANR